MAKDKKKVIVYADWIDKFEELTDDEAGKLIKHFFRYINDLNPEAPDRTTKLLFIDIQNTLKRDLLKWEATLDEKSVNGRIGNLKRYNEDIYNDFKSKKITLEQAEEIAKTRKNSHSDKETRIATKNIAKLAVNVSDSDSVNDIVIKNNNIEERKLKFASTLESYLSIYGKDLLNDFYRYWTEPNKSNTKFKQELEKTWSLERRLTTWAKNDINFNKQKNGTTKITNANDYKELIDSVRATGERV